MIGSPILYEVDLHFEGRVRYALLAFAGEAGLTARATQVVLVLRKGDYSESHENTSEYSDKTDLIDQLESNTSVTFVLDEPPGFLEPVLKKFLEERLPKYRIEIRRDPWRSKYNGLVENPYGEELKALNIGRPFAPNDLEGKDPNSFIHYQCGNKSGSGSSEILTQHELDQFAAGGRERVSQVYDYLSDHFSVGDSFSLTDIVKAVADSSIRPRTVYYVLDDLESNGFLARGNEQVYRVLKT